MEASALNQAINTGYADNLRVSAGMQAKLATNKPMTEMESISANLGDYVRRLSQANDNISFRLDGFMQAPSSIGREAQIEQPEPSPGTIGSLKFLLVKLEAEVARTRNLEGTLSGIL